MRMSKSPSYFRNRLRLMGLIIFTTSAMLALALPAIGIERIEFGAIRRATSAQDRIAASTKHPHVWMLLGVSGSVGLVLWIVGGTGSPTASFKPKGGKK